MELISNQTTKPTIVIRKPYRKPKVEKVQLVLEEAVLGTGCKSASSNGPTNPCNVNFSNCLINGS